MAIFDSSNKVGSAMIVKLHIIALTFIVLFASKSELFSANPHDQNKSKLIAAPETLRVDNYLLTLTCDLWRDFQPISPPDGKPLIAFLYISAINTDSISTPLDADAIWLIYKDETWRGQFTGEKVPPWERKPNNLIKIARNGPKWGPGVCIDVVVRIIDAKGSHHLLRASKQFIQMTI
jgi:hypothetical protein